MPRKFGGKITTFTTEDKFPYSYKGLVAMQTSAKKAPRSSLTSWALLYRLILDNHRRVSRLLSMVGVTHDLDAQH